MITRRRLLLTATGALALAAPLAATPPAWATGGNDPIPGIDIIILEDPASRPIKPFSLDKPQLEKLASLSMDEGAAFLSELIAAHLKRSAPDCCGKVTVPDLTAALAKEWCGPCKMVEEVTAKVPMDKGALLITLKIQR